MAWYKNRKIIIPIIIALISSPFWSGLFSSSSEKVSAKNSGAGATTISTDGGSQNSIEAATINVAGDHNTIINGSKNKEGPKKSEEVFDYATAQYYLGLAYQDGRGIAFSDSKAVQAWQEAATHGNAEAQFLLGRAYEFGKGIQANLSEALKWYKMAANQGNADAMNSVGNLYNGGRKEIQKDPKEAIRWYQEAVKKNNVNATYNLAQMYYSGDGIARNRRKAFVLFQNAADQGDSDGQYMVAVYKYYGLIDNPDKADAVSWLKKAYDQGNVSAAYVLGIAYINGEGIKYDSGNFVRGVDLLKDAAAQGDTNAKNALNQLQEKQKLDRQIYLERLKQKSQGEQNNSEQ